jgi:tetratricopeptide (TPR) repeat protein
VPSREPAPEIAEEVTGRELDKEVREELRTLTADNADTVAKHLVMAARLIDDDPELAYAHAKAAQRTAARVPSVREACGLAAYAAGKYSEALAELRAARRMSGSNINLPVMADCERGLGRPERALALASGKDVASLDREGRLEMRIVAAGARRDLGQLDAAVLTLQIPDLNDTRVHPWTPRLRFAYADALAAVGRTDEALDWFRRAADADPEGHTDADLRLAELEGLHFVDAEDDEGGVTAVAEETEEGEDATTAVDDAPVPAAQDQGAPVEVAPAGDAPAAVRPAVEQLTFDEPGDDPLAPTGSPAVAPAYGGELFQEPRTES